MPEMGQFLDTLGTIFAGSAALAVLFRHGTLVLLDEASSDPGDMATKLLKRSGPVAGGSNAGDFGTLTLTHGRGWLVTCHHEKIFTFVPPNPDSSDPNSDMLIGLLGRANRHRDATDLEIVALIKLAPSACAG